MQSLKSTVSLLIVFQLLVGCGKGLVTNKKSSNSKEAKEVFRIQGEFKLLSKMVNFIISSAHADPDWGALDAAKSELTAEIAVSVGRLDGLNANLDSIDASNPRPSKYLENSSENFCHSMKKEVSYTQCPKGEICAFIREVSSKTDKDFSCGVILKDDRKFNFKFSLEQEKVFAQNKDLEVVMVDSQYNLDHDELDLRKEELTDLIVKKNELVSIMDRVESRWNDAAFYDSVVMDLNRLNDTLIPSFRGLLDSLEAKIADLSSKRINILVASIISKNEIKNEIRIDEARMYTWLNYDKRTPQQFHSDPWMKAIEKFINFDRTLVVGSWGLNQGLIINPEDEEEFNKMSDFISTGVTNSEDFNAGQGWQFNKLNYYKKQFSYYIRLPENDDDIINRDKIYSDYLIFQIAYEKQMNSSAPIIPVETMIAGINSLDSEEDHELILQYIRLGLYLKHAEDIGYDMAQFADLIVKYESIEIQALDIIGNVRAYTYKEDLSCDWSSYEACEESFKKDLTYSIVNDYFNTYASMFLFLAPDNLLSLY